MNLYKNLFLVFVLLCITFTTQAQVKKVACVGNSITYGYGIQNREVNSYPSQLQNMLGDNYLVGNFGHSGATLLNKGHNPYIKTKEYQKALLFKADYVIIHLGINDTDPRNYPKYRDEFTADYIQLIKDFKVVNPNVQVWICKMTPIFTHHKRFQSSTQVWYKLIQKDIERVAYVENLPIIDFYEPLYTRVDLFEDSIHPDKTGAHILAKTVYQNLTGNYGGLQLDPIFNSGMVLQRGKDIKFWGIANSNDTIEINFNNQKKTVATKKDGKWSVSFPPLQAGGPYTATFLNSKNKIELNDLLIGDVWICSGQSNMAFRVNETNTYKEDKYKLENRNIRLYNMDVIAQTTNTEWSKETLELVNQDKYYKPTSWVIANNQTVPSFSAIGYYFASELQNQLNIPIGIINNAVGGSTTESWISREDLENHPKFLHFYDDWANNDFIDSWVRGRTLKNITLKDKKLQKHPYQPSYLYENGVKPFEEFPITGVIWYQGESNANNVELHEELFPYLVKSWRKNISNDMPFYFVQLSSMESGRETWGHFRDSQRRLAEKISNSGLVVSSDLGDRYDVHPKNKKPIALRMAHLALNDHYGKSKFDKSGPTPKTIKINNRTITILFDEVKKLTTSDKQTVRGVEVAGVDKIYKKVSAQIRGNKLIIHSDVDPVFVRYAWESFTDGNLTDENGNPASTFSNEYE